MDRKKLKQEAKEFINGKKLAIWEPILLLAIGSGIILGFLGAIFGEESAMYSLLSSLVSLALIPAEFGLMRYELNLVRGKEYKIDMLWEEYKNKDNIPKYIICTIIVGLCIAVGTAMLVVPGIIMGLSLYFYIEMMIDDEKLNQSNILHECREMMNGHKKDLFILELSFIGNILLGVITLGIYFIWLVPYIQTTTIKYYDSIKK